MILAEIFCANLGGSATMCGDPPNIIIGTSLGPVSYTHLDVYKRQGGYQLKLAVCIAAGFLQHDTEGASA